MSGMTPVVQVDMDVYGAEGEFIGRVKEVRERDFLVDRRMARDLYVPRDAVAEATLDGHRLTLTVTSADITEQGWEHPPLLGAAHASQATAIPTRIEHLTMMTIDAIEAGAPIADALRDMEIKELRSLLVVENERPVGVLLLRDIRGLSGQPAQQPVRTRMHTGLPQLTPELSVEEARQRLNQNRPGWLAAVDTLPVVNADGRLIGEVEHARIEDPTRSRDSGAADTTTPPPA